MEYVLVKYNSNWADEMDVEGFSVMQKETWDWTVKELTDYEDEIYYCVGTNEEIDYGSGLELLEDYSVTEITEEQYNVLKELNLLEFGFTGPDLEDLNEDDFGYED